MRGSFCTTLRLMRYVVPAPLALYLLTVRIPLPPLMWPDVMAAVQDILPAALAGLTYLIGVGTLPGAILVTVTASAVSAALTGQISLLFMIASIIASLLIYSSYLRCSGIREGFSTSSTCPGRCGIAWVATELVLWVMIFALTYVPIYVTNQLLVNLPRMAEALPPDTAPVWAALAASPVARALVFIVTLVILAWFYRAVASWVKVAALTNPSEARRVIDDYVAHEAEAVARRGSWYHRLFRWAFTLTFFIAADYLLAVALLAFFTVVSPGIIAAYILLSILLYLVARKAAKSLLQGRLGFSAVYVVVLAIMLSAALVGTAGVEWLYLLIKSMIGGQPIPTPLDDQLMDPEKYARLFEYVLRILTI